MRLKMKVSSICATHLQDVLDQLLLVVQGVLEAEQDAADHPDDQHHADDYERGRNNQE